MSNSTNNLGSINRLVVIGIGLIGGSLAAGLKQAGACREVIGIARREQTCADAVRLGVADRAYLSLSDVAAELGAGDVVFIAVPTLTVERVLADCQSLLSPLVTITDGASVKGSVVEAVRRVYGELPPQFVAGHPIAGSERSGVEASNPDLYQRHRVILTPTDETGAEHQALVDSMWTAVGAEVLVMPVAEHDEVLAATSHRRT